VTLCKRNEGKRRRERVDRSCRRAATRLHATVSMRAFKIFHRIKGVNLVSLNLYRRPGFLVSSIKFCKFLDEEKCSNGLAALVRISNSMRVRNSGRVNLYRIPEFYW